MTAKTIVSFLYNIMKPSVSFPIQHIFVLFLFLFFGHYIFRWPLILFNLPSCSASYCILLLHNYYVYQQPEVVYRNAPQFAAHCGCWRHHTVQPVCIGLYNSNTLQPPTDIFSFKKEKKSIFYDSGRFLLTIVFFFHSLLNSALAPRRHALQQKMGQLFFVYWLVVNLKENCI
jgi:hypothetical protein